MANEQVELDATNLRGIAHPIRVKLLGALRLDGPSTATKLAARLGLSSAATSYHLRQLAAYGFITEDSDAERGHGKERWWQAAHQSTVLEQVDVGGSDPETGAAAHEYLRAIARSYDERVTDWLDEMPTAPEEWRGSGTISDVVLRLTPQETADLNAEIEALVMTRRRATPTSRGPRGSRRVVVQWQVLPELRR